MRKPPPLQHELWPGPLRPTPQRGAIYSTRCVGPVGDLTDPGAWMPCGNATINGDFLCYACKDRDGYAARLRKAQHEARQRCLEAYPVCRHCGLPLTPEQVKAGISSHTEVGTSRCDLTAEELLANGGAE
jgi:hypothetical protein